MITFIFLFSAEPKFSAAITNVTVPVGREAILACIVQNLSAYKVNNLQSIYLCKEKRMYVCVCVCVC